MFAPTDEAFGKLPAGMLDFLLANPEILSDIIAYHVVDGEVFSSDLTDGLQSNTLLDGQQLSFSLMNGMFEVNDAMIGPADIRAFNGVVHVIDTVLVPPSLLPLPDVSALPSSAPSASPVADDSAATSLGASVLASFLAVTSLVATIA